jgi:hypothetical protein
MHFPSTRQARLGAALVATVALARGVFLAVLIPPYQAPDEPSHFDYVQRLAEAGRRGEPVPDCAELSQEGDALLRVMQPSFHHRERPVPPVASYRPPPPTPQARATRLCSSARAYSPLYYAGGALAYRAVRGAPFLERLLSARLTSVACGVLGALAAFLLGLWLLGDALGGLTVGLSYALQPTQALMFSTVNNDAALFAASAAAFAAAAALYRDPTRRGPLLAVAVAALLAVLAKPTFLLAVPALGIATAAAMGPRRPSSWLRAAAALAPAVAAGLAWELWSKAPPAGAEEPSLGPATGLAEFALRELASPPLIEGLWLKYYWMNWGWHDTRLPIEYYRFAEVLVVLALLGAVLGWRRLAREEQGAVAAVAVGTLAMLALLYAFEFLRAGGKPFMQSRYLLPLFAPQAAAMALSLRGLSRRLSAPVDGAFALPLFLAVMLGASALHALARYHG